MFEGKVPYAPPEAKRFQISGDKLSRGRLRAVLEGYRQVRDALPFGFGLAIFGSLSKGKVLTEDNAHSADIDLTLFLDRDTIMAGHAQLSMQDNRFREVVQEQLNVVRKIAIGSSEAEVYQSVVYSEATRYVKERLRGCIFEKLPDNDKFCKLSIYHILLDRQRLRLCLNNFNTSIIWATLFGLDIGGGLRDYRREMLLGLQKMDGGEGKKYWENIIKSVKISEREGDIPQAIVRQYPPTLNQAILYYGAKVPNLAAY